jgi:hypothetical protein
MGWLIDKLEEDVLSDAGVTDDDPEEGVSIGLHETKVSFTHRISADKGFLARQAANLDAVLAARNELTHHFLPRWDPGSQQSTRAAIEYLDAHLEEALPVRAQLRAFVVSMRDSHALLSGFLASDEAWRPLEQDRQQHSPLVVLLRDIAAKIARSDGWAVLARAGQLATLQAPEELTRLQERHGHRTLKRLLMATEGFDVRDEPTAGGGFRTVYRVTSAA